MYKRNMLGSNQYITRTRIKAAKRSTGWKVLLAGYAIFMLAGLISDNIKVPAQNGKIISPIPEVRAADITPSPTPEPIKKSLEYDEVDAEIKRVFGKHYETAMLLLKGDGKGGCHENGGLNPNAINHNTDQAQSTDYGVFQINDYWQGIRHDGKAKQFLLDPKINISIAWRLFEDNGYSFNLWTCGRYYGI